MAEHQKTSDSPRPDNPIVELMAAVGVAASAGVAVLVGAGYAILLARLKNLGIPASPVLSTLPTSFFIGEAVGVLALSLVTLLVAAVAYAVALAAGAGLPGSPRDRDSHFRGRAWGLLALTVAVCAWALDLLARAHGLANLPATYWAILAALLAATLLVPMWLASRPIVEEMRPRSPRLAVTAALVSASILSVASIRILDAAAFPDPFPAVFVSAEQKACPFLGSSAPHCFFEGYYIGESEKWMYLVQNPNGEYLGDQPESAGVTMKGSGRVPLKDHILVIPRDDIEQADIAEDFPSIPLCTKCPGVKQE
jgi:hypothetical protein